MTPQEVPEFFEREMGCEARELVAWLPVALPDAQLSVEATTHRAHARFGEGTLTLAWHVLVPRRIALLEIPRLRVSFHYVGLDDDRRREVQRRFDLATQRGGG